jgi:small-conductance mechanosensitive channel/CRP-like cAMP-binding protein
MNLDSQLLLHVAEAVGLGLATGLVLWLLRGFAPARRVQLSVLAGALVLGLYWIASGSGLPGEEAWLRALLAMGVMLAANTVLQLFDWLVWDYLLGQRRHLPIPRLLVDLFNFIALTAAALVVLNRVFEVNLSGLLVTSTVLSAVIGLSLQDILGNVVAGVALQLERPFAVGDWVLINNQLGKVVQMSWRTLTLRTLDDNNIFIPNASAAKNDITNYTRPTPLTRLHVEVGVAYRHPPGQVSAVLARAAASVEAVAGAPPVEVLVKAYGDSAVYYDVRFWITDYALAEPLRGAVLARMWYELKRAGMTIPFPQRDVTLRTLPEDYEARAVAQLRREVATILRPLAVFAPLSDAQIEQLAQNASLQRYTPGEVLVRQGDSGDSLFLVRAGQVRVSQRTETGSVVTLVTMGPEEFFGELSLLTGEPRSASVIAERETEVVVVDKAAFAAIIAADASMAEALSEALAVRLRRSAERVLSSSEAEAKQPAPQPAQLLGRIRRFFGIK